MTRTRGPGPKYLLPATLGMNNHDPTLSKAPGYSFGSRYSYSFPPAPGPYFIESGLSNRGKDNNAGFTLHGRPKKSIWEVAASNSPGPAYAVNTSTIEKTIPAYSFGVPYKHNYETNSPGPNAYSVPSDWSRNTKGALIGSRSNGLRSFAYDYANTPGPAHYGNPHLKESRGPAFTMGQRWKGTTSKLITPGPNMYNPGMEWTSPRSPRFSMGIRHHEEVIPMADVYD